MFQVMKIFLRYKIWISFFFCYCLFFFLFGINVHILLFFLPEQHNTKLWLLLYKCSSTRTHTHKRILLTKQNNQKLVYEAIAYLLKWIKWYYFVCVCVCVFDDDKFSFLFCANNYVRKIRLKNWTSSLLQSKVQQTNY